MILLVRSLAQKINLEKAVLYGVLSKIWLFFSGPVSLLLVANFFTPSLQGYYYTFATILALQIFIELGLGTVTQQFASHEWAKLSRTDDGRISGDPEALSKLASIAQISFKWFLYGSILSFLGLLIGGYFFFNASPDVGVSWLLPWVGLSFLAALNILCTPFWSLLEGCNQVASLYGFRLLMSIAMNISVWIAIICRTGLWAASIGNLVGILLGLFFIVTRHGHFFKTLLFTKPSGPTIKWKTHMLPMQWRIAVSWISGYLSFSLFTPILFKYQGAEVAGMFGMTWNIISTLTGISNAWLAPKVPSFAILIAKRDYFNLDKLFWRLVKIILGVTALLSLLAWLTVFMLPRLNIPLATKLSTRLLAPEPMGILLIAQMIMILSTPFSYYMRAHKKEPLMILSVVGGLMIGFSTFYFGKYYSVKEVALGYLVANALIVPMIIYVWREFRRPYLT